MNNEKTNCFNKLQRSIDSIRFSALGNQVATDKQIEHLQHCYNLVKEVCRLQGGRKGLK